MSAHVQVCGHVSPHEHICACSVEREAACTAANVGPMHTVVCAHLERGRGKLPSLLPVQRGHRNAARDEAVAGSNGDRFERPLDAVKDVVEDPGAELYRQGLRHAEPGAG
eukprot:365412-Chlamydomonas_euryale.AAC.11